MKRLFAGGLLLLLVAIGVFLWRQGQSSLSANQIAPADCLVYLELPDLVETAKRWPDTALCQILGEPSVRRFLKQPISKTPVSYRKVWGAFKALRCGAIFIGMTDLDNSHWICGMRTSVGQSTWRPEISSIAEALFGQNIRVVAPENLENVGSAPAEAARGEAQFYCTRIDSWVLVSCSARLLLDAVRNSKTASGGLQSQKLFQECRSNVPTGHDLLTFVKGGPSLDSSTGLHWQFREQENERSARAVLATTAIEGTRLRDTVFTLTGASPSASPFEQKGLAMTSPTTIGYAASQVGLSEIWRWCDQFSEESFVAGTIRDYMGQAKSFGIDPQDLDSLVSGAEVILDRDAKADSLNGAISLRVTDPEKFQRLIDQVVTEKFPDSCKKIGAASRPTYLVQVNNRAAIVFGLVGHRLLISPSESVFEEFVHRLQNHAPGLEANNQFEAIAKLVSKPNDLFVYLDAKAGFERFYEVSKPMLVLGIALMPALSRYIDAMALPDTRDISKHLGPVVLSRHRVPNGVVDESVGPITAYEAVALLLGGGAAMGFWVH
jgi:hypothetical protein